MPWDFPLVENYSMVAGWATVHLYLWARGRETISLLQALNERCAWNYFISIITCDLVLSSEASYISLQSAEYAPGVACHLFLLSFM